MRVVLCKPLTGPWAQILLSVVSIEPQQQPLQRAWRAETLQSCLCLLPSQGILLPGLSWEPAGQMAEHIKKPRMLQNLLLGSKGNV